MSNIKVAFVCPCLGVGGADATMIGLAKYWHHVTVTGILVERDTCGEQLTWSRKAIGGALPPIHSPHQEGCLDCPGIIYHGRNDNHRIGITSHTGLAEASRAATADADVVIGWSCDHASQTYPEIDTSTPIIEWCQNSDRGAAGKCNGNCQLASHYVACSRSAASAFPPDVQSKVKIIYNGFDPARCVPRLGGSVLRRALRIDDDIRLAVYCGRLEREKNVSALIEAIGRLPDEWQGLIVGRGNYVTETIDHASDAAPGRIHFLHHTYQIGDVLDAASVFVLVSDFEGDSVALHEAHYDGVPAVVSRLPVVDEIHAQFGGELSVVVPVSPTPDELSQAILLASQEDNERPRRAHQATKHHFGLPKIASQWEFLLNQIVYQHRAKTMVGAGFTVGRRQQLTEAR